MNPEAPITAVGTTPPEYRTENRYATHRMSMRSRNGPVCETASVTTSCTARLLVATPPLEDPNFDRSVVFLIEHGSHGALGVVLNRPAGEGLVAMLAPWNDLLAAPAEVFSGGPVEPEALIALGRPAGARGMITPLPGNTPRSRDGDEVAPAAEDDPIALITAEVLSVDLRSDPALLAAELDTVRIFRGYAGWGPGQLDDEIERGDWLVLTAEVDDLFGDQPSRLWRTVLHRQRGRLAWLAFAPDDLGAN